MKPPIFNDTIVAPSTPPGISAIAVIRLSGESAIQITDRIFKGKRLSDQPSHTLHFGRLMDGDRMLDEVVVSLFKAPNSFTREDCVEISTHGSPYIVEETVKLLIRQGARMAEPGEFTRRAFLNGRFDLAQAEAVADLIHSDSKLSHEAAIHQMRGGISKKISALREKLLNFASLVELELDFGEEDVEFADRSDLRKLILELQQVVSPLLSSFDMGQAIKSGVPVVIAGKPNAGKSTLLNAILKEEKAIVSEIAGTTRDVIEDQIQVDGITFRFIDTAGLRETGDQIEAIGVQRAYEQMKKAGLIIYLFDVTSESAEELYTRKREMEELGRPFILVGNKTDKVSHLSEWLMSEGILTISAKEEASVEKLKSALVEKVKLKEVSVGDTLVTNGRHYAALLSTEESLTRIVRGLDLGLTGDLLAEDIRSALGSLGEITGEVTNDEVLGNIFSKFCIGK